VEVFSVTAGVRKRGRETRCSFPRHCQKKQTTGDPKNVKTEKRGWLVKIDGGGLDRAPVSRGGRWMAEEKNKWPRGRYFDKSSQGGFWTTLPGRKNLEQVAIKSWFKKVNL